MVNINPKDSSQIGGFKGVSTTLLVIAVIVIAFIILHKVFGFFDGILEGLNLKDTKEEKENKDNVSKGVDSENSKGLNSYWNPNFYKDRKGAIFTMAKGKQLAKQLWDSVGYIYDTPSEGSAAIKQCSSGMKVSFVADVFNTEYNLDLLTWLQNKYDTTEQKEILADIIRYVKALPKT